MLRLKRTSSSVSLVHHNHHRRERPMVRFAGERAINLNFICFATAKRLTRESRTLRANQPSRCHQ